MPSDPPAPRGARRSPRPVRGLSGSRLGVPWRAWRPWLGAALALAYVLAVVATVGLRAGHVRPLYEGFTPTSSYRWVNPPKLFAAGNQKPTPHHASVRLGPHGSLATGVATADAQVQLGLAAGAIAPHGTDTSVDIAIIPLDPATVAALPAPYNPDGNAYDIAMTYRPSGVAVTKLSGAGASLLLTIPESGQHLFNAAGKSGPWTLIPSHNVPPTNLILGASIHQTGYYLAGTTLPPLGFPVHSDDEVIDITAAVAVLAVLVIGGAVVLSRRRRRRAAAGSGPS